MADSSGKLYFLRDRGKRASNRAAKRRTEGLGAAGVDHHRPSREAIWLSRVLITAAAYFVLSWLGVIVGILDVPGNTDSRMWLYSFLPADLFVAFATGLAGADLLRGSPRRDFFLLIASGAILFVAIERLTYGIASSFLRELFPGERLNVTLAGVWLYVGLWSASYSQRLRRGGE